MWALVGYNFIAFATIWETTLPLRTLTSPRAAAFGAGVAWIWMRVLTTSSGCMMQTSGIRPSRRPKPERRPAWRAKYRAAVRPSLRRYCYYWIQIPQLEHYGSTTDTARFENAIRTELEVEAAACVPEEKATLNTKHVYLFDVKKKFFLSRWL